MKNFRKIPLLVVSAALAQSAVLAAPPIHHEHGDTMGGREMPMAHSSRVHTHSTRMLVSVTPARPMPNQSVKMSIRIVDKADGQPVKAFDVVHAKSIHLVLAADDLSWFNHIHPRYLGNGQFVTQTKFPRAGQYRLYGDYKPHDEEGEVALYEFEVGKAQATAVPLVADRMQGESLVKRVVAAPEGQPWNPTGKRYRVSLMPMPARIVAGQDVMLHFQVCDNNGKPVKLQPYLGAQGHCVTLQKEARTYLHSHPMGGADGNNVLFHTNFPAAGLYKLWGQFQSEGKIITAPFTVKVGASPVAKTPAKTVVPAAAQRVTVSLPLDYKANAATVKAGQPLALIFWLKSDAGCGNTVVVPAANWSRTLKVGEKATVVFTPKKSGPLLFACGMNHLKGSLTVK